MFGLLIDYPILNQIRKDHMIKKRKDQKKSVLQRNPFMFYMTNWGFVEKPIQRKSKNKEKR